MTDAEIMKALECCCVSECDECPYDDQTACVEMVKEGALALINRQKAEIEKLNKDVENFLKVAEYQQGLTMKKSFEIKDLKAEIERLEKAGEEAVSCFTRMETLYKIKCKELEVAKTEVIKQFAERLKKHCYFDHKDQRNVVAEVIIDHYVKEMTEVNNHGER